MKEISNLGVYQLLIMSTEFTCSVYPLNNNNDNIFSKILHVKFKKRKVYAYFITILLR